MEFTPVKVITILQVFLFSIGKVDGVILLLNLLKSGVRPFRFVFYQSSSTFTFKKIVMQLALLRTKFNIFTFTLLWSFTTLSGFFLSLFSIEIGERPDVGILEAVVGGFALAFP
jgi:hypothetical protein